MEEDGGTLMDADSDDVELVSQLHHRHHLQPILNTYSSGEDIEIKVPRKRAETWAHDETHSLITFRRGLDEFFNTSKSNKHLWEQIAARMNELGHDRTVAMCIDKWRNLLKDYKKAQQRDGGSGKVYYEELEEFYAEKKRNDPFRKIASSKAPSLLISDNGESFLYALLYSSCSFSIFFSFFFSDLPFEFNEAFRSIAYMHKNIDFSVGLYFI